MQKFQDPNIEKKRVQLNKEKEINKLSEAKLESNEGFHTLDAYVGQRLRDFREKVGLTLTDCAEKVGVSHQQIHKYELGQTRISANMLYKFCKLFSISPNCFFEGYNATLQENPLLKEDDITRYPKLDQINVLLIEDSAEDQFVIRRAFEEYDFKVNFYCAHDGEEFLNIIRKKFNIMKIPMPDLILVDLNLPKINGKELLRAIKQNKDLKYIPVIILTGSISRKDVIDSYNNYASGYIRKTFEYETFKKNISIALNYWLEAVVLPHHGWS